MNLAFYDESIDAKSTQHQMSHTSMTMKYSERKKVSTTHVEQKASFSEEALEWQQLAKREKNVAFFQVEQMSKVLSNLEMKFEKPTISLMTGQFDCSTFHYST